MKKKIILLLMTLAMTAYSRDYEYNERRDITIERIDQDTISRSGRENSEIGENFYVELTSQSRGHEDR